MGTGSPQRPVARQRDRARGGHAGHMSLPPELLALAGPQDGVVSRAQLVAAGLGDHVVRRLVRRRLLAPVHRGVFVDHTGTLTWRQAAWAAVLLTAPSALDGCPRCAPRACGRPARTGRCTSWSRRRGGWCRHPTSSYDAGVTSGLACSGQRARLGCARRRRWCWWLHRQSMTVRLSAS
ncbi:hypothetical protein E2C04_02390 [Nocardioides daphniae]|uniref:Uncharacterized protein n=1 Tax=Nocardioides daphniae TaxID=402297 RepID=A0A4P7U853_9ACTN|nr:hypothetical protein E2C04_02390 [Nocardioides daphniae]